MTKSKPVSEAPAPETGKSVATQAKRSPKGPGGRPSDYTLELADEICSLIGKGKSLKKITEMDGMPKQQTVYRWLREKPEFCESYKRARDDQADTLFDEIIDIADDKELEPHDRRVRIDARKWAAGQLRPKLYGPKVVHTGDAEGDAIKTTDGAAEKLASLIGQIAERVPMKDVTPPVEGITVGMDDDTPKQVQ